MLLNDVLARLQNVKKASGYYQAACPAHNDCSKRKDGRSLSVKEGRDGKIVLFCHAGCSFNDIVAAMGIEPKDLMGPSDSTVQKVHQGQNIEAVYEYVDEAGKHLFQVVRGFGKKFYQRRRMPDGEWKTGLNGAPLTLYRLPAVLAAVKAGKRVYLVEGEKDVHSMEKAGVVATCIPMGVIKQAGQKGVQVFRDTYAKHLRGADVVVIADNDEPGREHARKVVEALDGISKSTTVFVAAEGKDATDHLTAGRGIDDFVRARDLEPASNGFTVVTLSDVTPEEVDFLWYPYIPRGRCTLLEGDGDVGKSYMTCAMAASLSIGMLPDGTECEPMDTVMFACEDEVGDTILPRINKLGGDPSRIHHIEDLFALNATGLKRTRETVLDLKAGLVVFDPILAYMGEGVNINQANEVRPILHGLKLIAREANVGWLNIRHITKGGQDREQHHNGVGSVDIRNAHRSQVMVRWHPERAGVRCIVHTKHNLSEQGDMLGYSFSGGMFGWLLDMEPVSDWGKRPPPPKPDDEKLARAKDAIIEILTGKAVLVKELDRHLKEMKLGIPTIRRAKARLGVVANKTPDGWTNALPAGFDPFADDTLPYWNQD